jgi:hypothetical protein
VKAEGLDLWCIDRVALCWARFNSGPLDPSLNDFIIVGKPNNKPTGCPRSASELFFPPHIQLNLFNLHL